MDPETGRFLNHDPVVGDTTNPPSLHRYLYAFQNPTVFVDPTGGIAELVALADLFGETKQFLLHYAANLDDDPDETALERAIDQELAKLIGRFAGTQGFAESTTRTANLILLIEKAQGADFGRLTADAEAETSSALKSLADVTLVREGLR